MPRHSATNARLVLPLAWMEALLAAQSLLHCLAVFGSAIADCDKASSPTNAVHTAAVKVGFITRLSGNFRSTPAASQPQRGREALPRLAAATWNPQLLTGSRIMFSICSQVSRQIVNIPPKKAAAPFRRRHEIPSSASPRQCAVSVEESASTAGSVVTEVSVGL